MKRKRSGRIIGRRKEPLRKALLAPLAAGILLLGPKAGADPVKTEDVQVRKNTHKSVLKKTVSAGTYVPLQTPGWVKLTFGMKVTKVDGRGISYTMCNVGPSLENCDKQFNERLKFGPEVNPVDPTLNKGVQCSKGDKPGTAKLTFYLIEMHYVKNGTYIPLQSPGWAKLTFGMKITRVGRKGIDYVMCNKGPGVESCDKENSGSMPYGVTGVIDRLMPAVGKVYKGRQSGTAVLMRVHWKP